MLNTFPDVPGLVLGADRHARLEVDRQADRVDLRAELAATYSRRFDEPAATEPASGWPSLLLRWLGQRL